MVFRICLKLPLCCLIVVEVDIKLASVGISKSKNKRSRALQNQIKTFYDQDSDYLITAFDLFTCSTFIVEKNMI
jgi:hypothetical protein